MRLGEVRLETRGTGVRLESLIIQGGRRQDGMTRKQPHMEEGNQLVVKREREREKREKERERCVCLWFLFVVVFIVLTCTTTHLQQGSSQHQS